MLVFPFLGLILLSVALVGYVSMRNGQQGEKESAFQIFMPVAPVFVSSRELKQRKNPGLMDQMDSVHYD